MHHLISATVSAVQGWPFLPAKLRVKLLRVYGMQIGSNVGIYENVYVSSNRVTIGSGSFINIGCVLDAEGEIILGENVFLAHCVKLITSSHEIGGPGKRAGALQPANINIGDGCWLGAGVTVLPGITIASGCILAAGSVVTKNCEANGLYAGVPARRVRELPV